MATIQVRIYDTAGRPIDGTVTMNRQGYRPFTCRSVGGRCQITGVPVATYFVSVAPVRGLAPSPRSYRVPRDRGTFVLKFLVPPAPRQDSHATTLKRQLDRCRVENMMLRVQLSRAR